MAISKRKLLDDYINDLNDIASKRFIGNPDAAYSYYQESNLWSLKFRGRTLFTHKGGINGFIDKVSIVLATTVNIIDEALYNGWV